MNQWANYRKGLSPTTHPYHPKQGVAKSPFQIATTRLEIDKHINRKHLITHLLNVRWCHDQSYNFRQSPKWVKADRAQYVRSSSGLITCYFKEMIIIHHRMTDWQWKINKYFLPGSPASLHINSIDSMVLLNMCSSEGFRHSERVVSAQCRPEVDIIVLVQYSRPIS